MPFWESNIFWGTFGFITAAVFFYLSLVFGKKKAKLEYKLVSTRLISGYTSDIPGLSITIDGYPVEDLIISQITFCNTGSQNIESQDFLPENPLHVTSTERIFHVKLKTLSNPNVGAQQILIDESTCQFQFALLKPGWSFSAQVAHTGVLKIEGCLKTGLIKPAFSAR